MLSFAFYIKHLSLRVQGEGNAALSRAQVLPAPFCGHDNEEKMTSIRSDRTGRWAKDHVWVDRRAWWPKDGWWPKGNGL